MEWAYAGDGEVIFAISQGEVSFDTFARLFRDGLNCPNALFLDGGSAPSLYAPSLNRHGNNLVTWPDAGCIREKIETEVGRNRVQRAAFGTFQNERRSLLEHAC